MNNEVITKTKIVTAYGTNLINSLSAKVRPSKKLGMIYKAPNKNEPKILIDGFHILKITNATAIHPYLSIALVLAPEHERDGAGRGN